MVCRENPAGSLAIALARRTTWFDDAQLQSVFHRLSHEYHDDVGQPTGVAREQMIAGALTRHRQAIEADPVLGADQRAALRRRLAAAEERRESCPEGVYWASLRFHGGLADSQRALDGRLREIAGQRGMSMREARAEFFVQRDAMPAVGRGGNTAPSAAERVDLGVIPSDGRTRYALAQMQAGEPVTTPRRVVDRVVAINSRYGVGAATQTADPSRTVRVGWSSGGDRLETYTADGTTHAYTVAPYVTADLETAGSAISPGLLQAALAQAEPVLRAEQTAWAARCDDCGQYQGANHLCPNAGAVATSDQSAIYTREGAVVHHPPLELMAHHLAAAPNGEALISMDAVVDGHHVQGQIGIRRGVDGVRPLDRDTRGVIDVDAVNDRLACTCMEAPHCAHVQQGTEMFRRSIARSLAAGPRPAVVDELEVAAPTVRPTTRARPVAPSTTAPAISFIDNPDTFRDVILGANRVVPFFAGDNGPALTGYAAGVRFGVEMEFSADGPGTVDSVIRGLVDRHILAPDRGFQTSYHTAQREGWNRWTLERDGSVTGGELVMPIFSDQPENWRQLGQACEALGVAGVSTQGAGSHTNISTEDFSPEMGWRLARLFRTHEDDIRRMGRTRGCRRNQLYSQSLPDPGPQWQSFRDSNMHYYHRTSAINFTQTGTSNPRLEFRFPDASNNPGVIQAQVRLCAAMTNYVRDNDVVDSLPARPQGTSLREGWTRNLMSSSTTAEDFARHTLPVRTLIDTLFDTDAARQQIAILWGRGAYR